MNVAVHIHCLAGGGAERIAALLCSQLAERGHRVLLITQLPADPGDYPVDVRVERISIGGTDVTNAGWRWLRMLRRVVRLRTALRQFEAEVVLGFMTTSALYVAMASVASRVKAVCCERVDPKQQRLSAGASRLRKWLYPRAEHVVVQTEGALAWLEAEIPMATGCVIPNPIQYPLTELPPILQPEVVLEAGASLVLGVGRLDHQKGFDRLIEAFVMLAAEFPLAELVILGEGEMRAGLEALIEARELADRIHLVGRVGNLSAWYGRAELFVLSSRYEGFPNALAEAMAHGCAVLATDCDFGPDDLIENGHSGVLADADTAEALSEAMRRLLSDAALRVTLGTNARTVREHYDVHKVIDRWETLLLGQDGSVVES